MTKKLGHILEQLPAKRRTAIETRAGKLAKLKDAREAMAQTQQDDAATPGVGQNSISHHRIK